MSGLEIAAEGLSRDLTLTGRTEIWRDLLEMSGSPLVGVGYESFWLGDRLLEVWDKYSIRINEAHSGYLEIYLDLGLVGLTLLLVLFVCSYVAIVRRIDDDFDYARFRIAWLIVVLIYNLTESSFKGYTLAWFVLMLTILVPAHEVSGGSSGPPSGSSDESLPEPSKSRYKRMLPRPTRVGAYHSR